MGAIKRACVILKKRDIKRNNRDKAIDRQAERERERAHENETRRNGRLPKSQLDKNINFVVILKCPG